MVKNDIDLALQELGAAFGEEFALDADGVLTLEFTATTCTIEMPRDSSHVYVRATVQRLPLDGQESVLRKALELNLFQLGLPGMFLALDATAAELQLCQVIAIDAMPEHGLAAILLGLVEAVGDIVARLGQHPVSQPVEDASNLAFGGEMIFLRS